MSWQCSDELRCVLNSQTCFTGNAMFDVLGLQASLSESSQRRESVCVESHGITLTLIESDSVASCSAESCVM